MTFVLSTDGYLTDISDDKYNIIEPDIRFKKIKQSLLSCVDDILYVIDSTISHTVINKNIKIKKLGYNYTFMDYSHNVFLFNCEKILQVGDLSNAYEVKKFYCQTGRYDHYDVLYLDGDDRLYVKLYGKKMPTLIHNNVKKLFTMPNPTNHLIRFSTINCDFYEVRIENENVVKRRIKFCFFDAGILVKKLFNKFIVTTNGDVFAILYSNNTNNTNKTYNTYNTYNTYYTMSLYGPTQMVRLNHINIKSVKMLSSHHNTNNIYLVDNNNIFIHISEYSQYENITTKFNIQETRIKNARKL